MSRGHGQVLGGWQPRRECVFRTLVPVMTGFVQPDGDAVYLCEVSDASNMVHMIMGQEDDHRGDCLILNECLDSFSVITGVDNDAVSFVICHVGGDVAVGLQWSDVDAGNFHCPVL